MKNFRLSVVMVWTLCLFISQHVVSAQKNLQEPDGDGPAADLYNIPDPPTSPRDSTACQKTKAFLRQHGVDTNGMSCEKAFKAANEIQAQLTLAEKNAEKSTKSTDQSSSMSNPGPAANPNVPLRPRKPSIAEKVQTFADALQQLDDGLAQINPRATQDELANESLQQQELSPDRLPQENGSPDLRSDDQRHADANQQTAPISVAQSGQKSILEQLLDPAVQAGANLAGESGFSNDRGSPEAYQQPGLGTRPIVQVPNNVGSRLKEDHVTAIQDGNYSFTPMGEIYQHFSDWWDAPAKAKLIRDKPDVVQIAEQSAKSASPIGSYFANFVNGIGNKIQNYLSMPVDNYNTNVAPTPSSLTKYDK